jgi:hypothetical protein
MKITKKHVFIICGIIGLIVLVVVIIIKIVNTTPKTCDTSGGKKLYCDGENTVCINCGQGKTYDCDKRMCVVTCDTSGGKKLYCDGENTVCIDCGLNKTYDCYGKQCVCDTGLKECNALCCPSDKTCIKGVTRDSCCPTINQCGKDSTGNYTTCCEASDYCINPVNKDTSFCCDINRAPCGKDSTGNYTICCKGDEICNESNTCELKCDVGQTPCGTVCDCDKDRCIKNTTDGTHYCCPTGGIPCVKINGEYTEYCSGPDAACINNICSVDCPSSKKIDCSGKVCHDLCNNGQEYDCINGVCKCDQEHQANCGGGICCLNNQECYFPGGTGSTADCCDKGQRCVQNSEGVYTSCCGPSYMCFNNTCVLKCTLDNTTFLNCATDDNKCIKALNLSEDTKNKLEISATSDTNIVNGKVSCIGNDCAFCVIDDPATNFEQQVQQYPIQVQGLTLGSYIIGNLGGNPNPGYCSSPTGTAFNSASCNTYLTSDLCMKDTGNFCLWNSFIPQTKVTDDTALTDFYTKLNTQFQIDENIINKYNNKQDKTNNYYGVWKNKETGPSSTYVTIKKGENVSVSDCIAINKYSGVTNITYYDTNPSSKKLCLAGSNYLDITKDNCDKTVDKYGYSCNANGNITYDTSCKTSCESTDYSENNWYNQGVIWACSDIGFNSNNIKPCDTITNFCPDYNCSETQISSSYKGRQAAPIEGKLVTKEFVVDNPIGPEFYAWNSCLGDIRPFPAYMYAVPVRIINKTSRTIHCGFWPYNHTGSVDIEPNQIYPYTNIMIRGSTYSDDTNSDVQFKISFFNILKTSLLDPPFSGFFIRWGKRRAKLITFDNFFVDSSTTSGGIGITGAIFTDTYREGVGIPYDPSVIAINGVTVVYYPTAFQSPNKLQNVDPGGVFAVSANGGNDVKWRIIK